MPALESQCLASCPYGFYMCKTPVPNWVSCYLKSDTHRSPSNPSSEQEQRVALSFSLLFVCFPKVDRLCFSSTGIKQWTGNSDLEMLCDWSNAFSAAAFEASPVARRFLPCSAVQDVRHSRAESCLSFCQLEDWCEWGGGGQRPSTLAQVHLFSGGSFYEGEEMTSEDPEIESPRTVKELRMKSSYISYLENHSFRTGWVMWLHCKNQGLWIKS